MSGISTWLKNNWPFRRSSQLEPEPVLGTWPNPKESVGVVRDFIVGKRKEVKYTCWDAIGPARKDWQTLGPQIRSYVTNNDTSTKEMSSGDLTFHLYMVGRTEDTTRPIVMFRSNDKDSRERARAALKRSGIMENYPLIGVGTMPADMFEGRAFTRLASEDVKATPSMKPYDGPRRLIHSPAHDAAFGRRLFIQGEDPNHLRPATGGPLLFIDGMVLQLTAGHAFRDDNLNSSNNRLPEPPTVDNAEFDGMSDIGDDEEDDESPLMTGSQGKDNASSTAAEALRRLWRRIEGAISPLSRNVNDQAPEQTLDSPPMSQGGTPLTSADTSGKRARQPGALPGLVEVGKLFDLPRSEGLDYALVALHDHHCQGLNRIPSNKEANQRWLYVTKEWEIGKQDKSIATFTSTNGLVNGKLSATPSYLRFSGTFELHEVFSVMLEGKLAQGDCGSPVVDRGNGHFYGHIVAGSLGTGLAYIIPAIKIIQDIEKRAQKVSFSLQAPTQREVQQYRRGLSRGERWLGYEDHTPFQFVDVGSKKFFYLNLSDYRPQFASRGYFDDLERMSRHSNRSAALGNRLIVDVSSQPSSSRSPASTSRARIANTTKFLAARVCDNNSRVNVNDNASESSHQRPRYLMLPLASLRRGNTQLKLQEQPSETSQSHNSYSGFSNLPLEILEQIMGYLEVPDILNLRLVSRPWNHFVTYQESDIAFAYLRQPHIPTLSIELFKPVATAAPNLAYIAGLWNRYCLASRLSDSMSEWITVDLFLRRKSEQRESFHEREALMRRRLVPLLLTISHFFETYRQMLLDPSTADIDHAAFERRIMEQYDDITLLQVHQFFPIFMTFQSRRLRPPSYLSHVERSFRGYHTSPPPENVQIAMLYLGGLREVFRLTRIGPYERLRTAVDEWYEGVTQSPVESAVASQSRGHMLLRSIRTSSSSSSAGPATSQDVPKNLTNTSTTCSTPSTATSISYVTAASGSNTGRQLGKAPMLISPTSLEVGQPMGPLSPDDDRLVLARLPTAKSQIWITTAESILLERGVVARTQDIKKNAAVLQELIMPAVSWLDVFFFERGINGEFDLNARVASLGPGQTYTD
ncbi:hypothetical protein B0H63DRAFT_559198 [Podospora didyma]|uniref:F-box domain-containing protein n=1 Tax=Podospora didyma TaxID=330526 RepID=A0AAE0U234_9PEZI|nr:hypothetical protein B0H63DRAFT_559198 [Podospora didyma]